jgi:hypothetical protein
VDDIAWVKATVNRRMAKGHGFYLQHAKETCLVGLKGEDPPNMRGNRCSDVIFSERRGQSQKPEEIYHIMEALVPNGTLLFSSRPWVPTLLALTSSTTTTPIVIIREVPGDLCPPKQPPQPLGVCGLGALGPDPPSCIQTFVRLLLPSTQHLPFRQLPAQVQ